jgi:hypothetical protein
MNFTQMLTATVRPLYDNGELPDGPKRGGNPNPNAERGWKSLMAKTEARYRAVMGDKWVGTREIENRLGMALTTARRYLTDRVNDGKMERRKVGPEDSWNRGKGYEWRWIWK